MSRAKRMQILCLCITLLITVFIFSNSAQSADDSSRASEGLYALVQNVFEKLGGEFPLTHNQFRKLAHFAEFAMLGAMLIATLLSYTTKIGKNIFAPLFFGLLIPIIDETIQLFCAGRSGEIRDVLIDFAGVLAGFCFAFLIAFIYKKRQR